MPTYVYETIEADGRDGPVFEVVQSMKEPPLTTHPETGRPVRRMVCAPNLVLRHGSLQEKQVLSDENIKNKGFTKYEKSDTGHYVRTAGEQGPSELNV